MISDPLTVPTVTLTFNGQVPATNGNSFVTRAFNTTQLGGRSTVRDLAMSDASSLSLAGGKISVSHQASNQGRLRSVFRVDMSTAAGEDPNPHSASCYLVVDREATRSVNSDYVLSGVLATLICSLVGATGSGALVTTSTCTEFLNGEP
jgi:hypothetical protein